jgi:CubicO group peptidase (beta-lactamase class C family)
VAFQVWSLRDIPARSKPGERFHYSNVGYKTLGLVLEAVTGGSYPDLLRARILKPLGMSATEPAITNAMRERLAVGYESSPLAPATWLETATADGSIASNAADMCAFARMLLRGGEGVLSEAAFARMSTVRAPVTDTAGYGFGLIVREIEGRTIIGHGGGMVGYLAALQVDPDAGIGSVVLQNGYGTNPMSLARAALGFAPEPPSGDGPPSEPAAEEPPAELRAIVGSYGSHNPWTPDFRVVTHGGEPRVLFPSAPDGFDDEQPLIRTDDDSFRVGEDPLGPESLRFDTEIDGLARRAFLSGWPFFRV